ncbi:sulfurtransferase complex subunit TusC [Chromatocurvus halotolerans]|uniref:tRNA 2-thiouridine synthesizing protein C n=1 Tax=Chromatocurvus halotolerans TaxID=1132028 RepID=A0A4R2KEZ3_9GAMM|nr:sulfurtransferase complex subunit TusC [Chromatocurvus halotolerans]TCO72231.1 tRNA 2-thiouridine synthesizing protein C [Chromatocurvus halotolerans]
MAKKSVLFILQHAPLGASLARAGIDTVLAYAAFDQPVSVLFSGAGVLQLAPGADCQRVGRRDLRRMIDSMPLYDIDAVFADAAALSAYGISGNLPPFVEAVESNAIRQLHERSDHILSF